MTARWCCIASLRCFAEPFAESLNLAVIERLVLPPICGGEVCFPCSRIAQPPSQRGKDGGTLSFCDSNYHCSNPLGPRVSIRPSRRCHAIVTFAILEFSVLNA